MQIQTLVLNCTATTDYQIVRTIKHVIYICNFNVQAAHMLHDIIILAVRAKGWVGELTLPGAKGWVGELTLSGAKGWVGELTLPGENTIVVPVQIFLRLSQQMFFSGVYDLLH